MGVTVENIKTEPMEVRLGGTTGAGSLDGTDVGCLEGDISFSISEETLDITCHQLGAQILDKKRTALNMEVSMVLKEVSTAQLNTILDFSGQSFTPAGGVAVQAIGTVKIGASQFTDAVLLTLHPVGAGDNLRDHTFFKAYPTVNSITFSGETPELVDITFAIFREEANDTQADIYVFGDSADALQVFT